MENYNRRIYFSFEVRMDGMFTKIDHTLGYRSSLTKFEWVDGHHRSYPGFPDSSCPYGPEALGPQTATV